MKKKNTWKTLLRKPFFWVLACFGFMALFADFLASDLPIYAKLDGKNRFPVLEKKASDWQLIPGKAELNSGTFWQNSESAVWAPVRYSSKQTDRDNDRFKKPHFLREDTPKNAPHYLGTDELGHDVAAILIHGAGIAFLIGILSMLLAACIGLMMGAAAGFWADNRLKASFLQISWALLGITALYFYGFKVQAPALREGLNLGGMAFITSVGKMLLVILILLAFFVVLGKRLKWLSVGRKIAIPLDFILSRFIEFMAVLPKIILILAISALFKPSVLLPALVIGISSWTGIARFTRAEMLRVRNMEYIRAAETLGLSEFRLFFRHALPNCINPLPSLLAFGIAGAILAESTLSYLGIGIPPDVFTWGKLLSQGRVNPSAWWVSLLPGLLIFLTVFSFHRLGEYLNEKPGHTRSFYRYFW